MRAILTKPENAIDAETFRVGIMRIIPFKLLNGRRPKLAVIVALQFAQYLAKGHRKGDISAFVFGHVTFRFNRNPPLHERRPHQSHEDIAACLFRFWRNRTRVTVDIPEHFPDIGIIPPNAAPPVF